MVITVFIDWGILVLCETISANTYTYSSYYYGAYAPADQGSC